MRPPLRRRLDGRGADRAGVSLVIVLISLLAVGLLALLAIPAHFNRHEVTLDNACRLLARDLRTLQNRAALEKSPVRMVFDSDGWRALDARGAPIGGIGETHALHRRFAGEGVFLGVVVERVDVGADGVLTIEPRGLVSEHAEVELSFRGERRLLRIHRGAGDVAVAPL